MILIAGGAGYIGSHVNKYLNRKGYETAVVDSLVTGHADFVKWGRFYRGDISDSHLLDRIFEENKIDAVMHFCAFAYVGESVKDPAKYYINNVSATLSLLNAMIKHRVKYFIFSSTCATYGDPVRIPIDESHPQNPVNPYGRSKLFVEKILSDYEKAYGIKYINLRYFNASGADPECEIGERHNPETHLIPLTIYSAIGKTQSITVFGTDYPTHDGTCIRDYIHVEDLAQAHMCAVEYLMKNDRSDSFNLGNGSGFSVKQIIDIVQKISGKKVNVINGPKREGDPAVLVADSSKALKLLGWKPIFNSIEQIIETAYRWHKKDLSVID